MPEEEYIKHTRSPIELEKLYKAGKLKKYPKLTRKPKNWSNVEYNFYRKKYTGENINRDSK